MTDLTKLADKLGALRDDNMLSRVLIDATVAYAEAAQRLRAHDYAGDGGYRCGYRGECLEAEGLKRAADRAAETLAKELGV